MHNPESLLQNEIHKILKNFKIRTYYLVPVRRPDLVLINKEKRTCHQLDFGVLTDQKVKVKESKKVAQSESERKQKDRHILGPGQKTTVKHSDESDTICSW